MHAKMKDKTRQVANPMAIEIHSKTFTASNGNRIRPQFLTCVMCLNKSLTTSNIGSFLSLSKIDCS